MITDIYLYLTKELTTSLLWETVNYPDSGVFWGCDEGFTIISELTVVNSPSMTCERRWCFSRWNLQHLQTDRHCKTLFKCNFSFYLHLLNCVQLFCIALLKFKEKNNPLKCEKINIDQIRKNIMWPQNVQQTFTYFGGGEGRGWGVNYVTLTL